MEIGARVEIRREYGADADVTSVRGALSWLRACGGYGPPRPIRTVGAYVARCRRIAGWVGPARDESGAAVDGSGTGPDGRLLAVGFGRYAPADWIGRGFWAFAPYWEAAVAHPATVGSGRNGLSPDQAAYAWQAGIPAWVARALGPHCLPAARGRGQAPRVGRARLATLVLAARAASRASARALTEGWGGAQPRQLGLDALRALGHLCPELQRVALAGARIPAEVQRQGADGVWRPVVVRSRDLDWGAVARAQRGLASPAGARVRLAMAVLAPVGGEGIPRRAAQLVGASTDAPHAAIIGALAPCYPVSDLAIAARLVLGESPASLSGGVLARQEAHRWLTDAPSLNPLAWLQSSLPEGCPALRSVAVVRWALDVARRGCWGQLTRERALHLPGGEEGVFRNIDRLDEIQDEDLGRGVATTVDSAFEAAAGRAGGAWLDRARGDHRVLAPAPAWRIYPRCSRWLLTSAQLVREGEELQHCVGTYGPAVERRQCSILALHVRGHRSTVELAPDGRVLQHHGPQNASPHELCERVLARILARNGMSNV